MLWCKATEESCLNNLSLRSREDQELCQEGRESLEDGGQEYIDRGRQGGKAWQEPGQVERWAEEKEGEREAAANA